MDIWVKFPISLCEKLCSKFKDKIKYVKKYEGKRINKELTDKIKKDKIEKNDIFVPIFDDNEWISVKRENNYRVVFNDQIVKVIKTRFIKQFGKQKESKIEQFKEDNKKIGKKKRNWSK